MTWTPPAAPIPKTDLPVWRLLWELRTSNISIWPEKAYEEMLLPRRVFGRDTLLVNDPAGIKQVLATNAAHFQRYMVTSRLLRPVAGDGVLLAEGEEWRRQRRIVAPAFTPATIEFVRSHFMRAGEGLCAAVSSGSDSSVNLYRLFQDAAIDGLGRGLFSMSFADRSPRLGSMARDYFAGPGRPNAGDSFARREEQFAWASRRRTTFRKRWFDEIAAVVKDWRQNEQSSSGHGRDIMAVLYQWRDPETGAPISERELHHQAATMIAAGFETTALAMFWTSYLLACDPARQRKIREELAAFPPGRLSRLDDLTRWPLLREALQEAMRLYPPVAFMSRIAVAPTVISGHSVSPGTIIVISPWVLHRHRRFWTDPQLFRPERFRDVPRAHLAGGAYIPFGSGPRTCIAAGFAMSEATILLAYLLSRYSLAIDPSDPPLMPRAIISTTPSIEPRFRLNALSDEL